VGGVVWGMALVGNRPCPTQVMGPTTGRRRVVGSGAPTQEQWQNAHAMEPYGAKKVCGNNG